MKTSHSHETPFLDGEHPWFPDMSCRFSMIFPSTHPLHDRIWTFAGNVERIISPWGEILGTWFQVIYSTPPLKETQSRQQALPEQGLELMKHQLSISFPQKKLKRKFTLMIVLRTSRKQTSLLCKFHRFSQKLKVMI